MDQQMDKDLALRFGKFVKIDPPSAEVLRLVVDKIVTKRGYAMTPEECENIVQELKAEDGVRALGGMLKKWDETKQAEKQESAHRQWLEDTDFSRGLKNSIPVPRPFKVPRPS